jgi:hypothetical protein
MPQASQSNPSAQKGATTLQMWTQTLDGILSTSPVDLGKATKLCMEICRVERDSLLGLKACRAYAALRRAEGEMASDLSVRASIRELEAVQLAILESQRRPFGKLRKGGSLIVERRLLGLPETGPLSDKDINLAFRTAAHDAHPDHGGSGDRFLALVAAREALLRTAE